MSKYKRKYIKGGKITSIDSMMTQKFIYFYDKITPIEWVFSWQLRLVKIYIDRGVLYYAIQRGEQQ